MSLKSLHEIYMTYLIGVLIISVLFFFAYFIHKNYRSYKWQPTCSAPKLFQMYTHRFYVKYGDDKAVTSSKDFYFDGMIAMALGGR